MNEFLSFRKMITPLIIQIIFWIGVALCLVMGIIEICVGANSYYGGGPLVLAGIMMILVGPLVVRIYCELLIVVFRIHDELTLCRKAVAPQAEGGHGFPVVPMPPR